MILNVDWIAYFIPTIPVLCLLRRLPPRGRSWAVAVQQCWHGREGHLFLQVVSIASWGLVFKKQIKLSGTICWPLDSLSTSLWWWSSWCTFCGGEREKGNIFRTAWGIEAHEPCQTCSKNTSRSFKVSNIIFGQVKAGRGSSCDKWWRTFHYHLPPWGNLPFRFPKLPDTNLDAPFPSNIHNCFAFACNKCLLLKKLPVFRKAASLLGGSKASRYNFCFFNLIWPELQASSVLANAELSFKPRLCLLMPAPCSSDHEECKCKRVLLKGTRQSEKQPRK